MTFLKRALSRSVSGLAQSERGATAIEYALIAALISVGFIGGLNAFADATNGRYNTLSTEISTAIE
jgi:pilus assembly protein Flp/PilA